MRARGLGLAVISYDSVAVLKSFAEREHIGFPMLSDQNSEVIRRYGILNETVDKGLPSYGIPHPGTYVLDARGVVVAKYFEEDYRVRDTAASILLREFGLTPPRHELVTAKHAKLSLAGADEPVRPDQRISLSVDVELPKRVHVYAPEVKGYIPVVLTLRPSTSYRADAVAYPPSKIMQIKVIHERVPVYEGRFRLVQMITLGNAPDVEKLLDADRNLAVIGEFKYQACDDRECFLPETVPLKWTLQVKPFDRARAPEELRRK